MKKRSLSVLVSIYILTLALLMTACGSGEQNPGDTGGSAKLAEDATGKYNPPITITACRFMGPQIKFADGESIENNIWTRAYEEKLGINIKHTFTYPDFQTYDIKINMAIASDSLPDLMPIHTTLFFRARDGGGLADLTDAYNKYLRKELKNVMNMYDGLTYKSCSKDGRLYAISGPPVYLEALPLMWVRTDWLKKLNLEVPKTMDDVVNVIRAFANNDPDGDGEKDTFGIAIDKDLTGVEGFSNGYHAYRNAWVERDGKLVRGDILSEARTALSKLAELYKAGAIDEEFVLKSGDDLKKDYANEALGLVFSGIAAPDGAINQSVKTNPGAEWEAYPIPSCDDKPALAWVSSRIAGFGAMSKKCKYPEAIMKLVNLGHELKHDKRPEAQDYHDKDGIDTFWYPVVGVGEPDYNYWCHTMVVDALKTGDTSKLNGEQNGYYKRMKTWIDNKNPEGWGMFKIFGPNSSLDIAKDILDKKLYYADKGWGPETPAWVENGPNLYYKAIEYFLNIIIGEKPIEAFDEWVEYFNNNGGTKATQEINDWYQKNK